MSEVPLKSARAADASREEAEEEERDSVHNPKQWVCTLDRFKIPSVFHSYSSSRRFHFCFESRSNGTVLNQSRSTGCSGFQDKGAHAAKASLQPPVEGDLISFNYIAQCMGGGVEGKGRVTSCLSLAPLSLPNPKPPPPVTSKRREEEEEFSMSH